MRIFFDTEFYENGKTIELISIGMVREDGAIYYAEATGAVGIAAQSEWLVKNVQPHLGPESCRRYKVEMRKEIVEFVGDGPEFWADYASYDWVVLCQIFGTMMDLPKGWPRYCNDIQQLRILHAQGIKPPIAPNPTEHNALADARDCKAKYDWLWDHRE